MERSLWRLFESLGRDIVHTGCRVEIEMVGSNQANCCL